MIDVAIIGGGISGTAIAYFLAKYNLNTAILEKTNDIANGATKANSGIVHGGYDAEPGTLMAKYNVEGNAMYPDICRTLDVPFRQVGSFVLAFDESDMQTLRQLRSQGLKNGVPETKIVSREDVLAMEPHVNPSVKGALYCKAAAVVSPYELAVAFAENAADHGCNIHYNSCVTDIHKNGDLYHITINDALKIQARCVINCAGTAADKIHNMLLEPLFQIRPRRGEYFLLDKYADGIANHVLFQCPGKKGKGVLVAPTAHQNVIVGPNAEDILDDEAVETTQSGLDFVRKSACKTIPNLPFQDIITTFSGIRAQPSTGDFIIRDYKSMPGFIDVAGIKSPGLTSAPAFARSVAKKVCRFFGAPDERPDYTPGRRKIVRFHECSHSERADLVRSNPLYGRIICRCETISEAEILDCIHRSAGARTLDSVKRRVRCGGGRCQGGFCGPKILDILSRELNLKDMDILKDSPASRIVTAHTKEDRS